MIFKTLFTSVAATLGASLWLFASPAAIDTLRACNNTQVYLRFTADSPRGLSLAPGTTAPVSAKDIDGWIDFGQIARRYELTDAQRTLLENGELRLLQFEPDGRIGVYPTSECPAAAAEQPAGFPLQPTETIDLT